jgi:glycosyltransferase involved in cell wall biosynthesis
MKFSIITPTHSAKNLPFLQELYSSILEQTYKNWEWILYLNNGMHKSHVPENIRSNTKVILFEAQDDNKNIGAIKNAAFNLGSGDVLVEVDHDDLLLPTCLEELLEAFKDPEVGFVYSDSITYHMENKFTPYRADHGWTFKTVNWRGQQFCSMNHFKPTSQSLSYIWYAPDHVRAWRTTVYQRVGGHNPSLSVCDDHELCIRTYLNTKMKLIPKPLYVYRITGDNTWLERNQLIQDTTRNLFNLHVRALAEKDADTKGLLKIDVGGGINPYSTYDTVDIRPEADYVADLNNGIPLASNSVGVLHCHHTLEHLKDPIKSMAEIHRVLAHGGWAFIEVPSTDGRGAWQDPTHISYWNQNSFFYYTKKEHARFIDNTDIRFQVYKLNTYFPNDFMRDNNIPVVCAVLVAIKDDSVRYPGLLEI